MPRQILPMSTIRVIQKEAPRKRCTLLTTFLPCKCKMFHRLESELNLSNQFSFQKKKEIGPSLLFLRMSGATK